MSSILTKRIHESKSFATLIDCIEQIGDTRVKSRTTYSLKMIIITTIYAVLGGANNWAEIEVFAYNHLDELIVIFGIVDDIPSHDTFNRVISSLNPSELRTWLSLWLEAVSEPINVVHEREQICIDGKVVRGYSSNNPLCLLRAFSYQSNQVICQQKLPTKSNEIFGLPMVLYEIDLRGKVITIDAIGTQKKIVRQINDSNAYYVSALKKNQHQLFDDVSLVMNDISEGKLKNIQSQYYEHTEKSHGRYEVRKCWVVQDIKWLFQRKLWKGLRSLIKVESTVTKNNKISIATRYFISNLATNAKEFLHIIRNHWMIENRLFWSLDTEFNEDRSTLRKGNSAENFGFIRTLCFSLLKNNGSNASLARNRMLIGHSIDSFAKTLYFRPV